MIERDQLYGLSLPTAERYGKPHWMAHYMSGNPTARSVDRYVMEEDATCIVCGKRATNVHHEPPKGKARTFPLATDRGLWVLRPALLAVCGSGTTGCHGDIHTHRIGVEWVWDEPGIEEAWWDGSLLESSEPHSPILYEVGFWRITQDGEVIREVRGCN